MPSEILCIGATNLDRKLRLLGALHPDLGEMMRRFGSAQVRASGTVGGIDSGTYTFWQNQVRDASDNSVTVSAATIEAVSATPRVHFAPSG